MLVVVGQEADNGQHLILRERKGFAELNHGHGLIFYQFFDSLPDSFVFGIVDSAFMFCHTDVARSAILVGLFPEIIQENTCPSGMFGMDILQHLVDTGFVTGFSLFVSRAWDLQIALFFPGLPIYN